VASALELDPSKDTLDFCLLIVGKRHEKAFPNDVTGHQHLLRWSQSLARASPCHFWTSPLLWTLN
jgi:hypothetical protein